MLLLIGAAFLYEWFASSQAKKDFPPPGTLVQVGGYQLHIHKQGNGSPTILMEAGSGETSLSWRDIPAELAQHATVVTYDRAGYAWSESAPTERTGANIVKDLHAALEKENIRGPYVMVGHSLGGCMPDSLHRPIQMRFRALSSLMRDLRMMNRIQRLCWNRLSFRETRLPPCYLY